MIGVCDFEGGRDGRLVQQALEKHNFVLTKSDNYNKTDNGPLFAFTHHTNSSENLLKLFSRKEKKPPHIHLVEMVCVKGLHAHFNVLKKGLELLGKVGPHNVSITKDAKTPSVHMENSMLEKGEAPTIVPVKYQMGANYKFVYFTEADQVVCVCA